MKKDTIQQTPPTADEQARQDAKLEEIDVEELQKELKNVTGGSLVNVSNTDWQ